MPAKLHYLFTLFLCYLITGCGAGGAGTGSGAGGINSGSPITGIDGTGGELPSNITKITSIGSITSENGITVNGVTYDSSNAIVTIDGMLDADTTLTTGQIVTIQGELNTNVSLGQANTINYTPSLRGAITSIDKDANTITILEQTVRLSDGVLFGAGLTLETIKVGDVVEISAYEFEDNQFSASRIDLTNSTNQSIRGRISDLNIDDSTFTLNGQKVNYANASLNGLSNGIEVSVSGTLLGNVLVSQNITILTSPTENTERIEIEGFPSNIADKFNFTINGIQVISNYAVEYIGGDSEDLRSESKIEIEGIINADGVLEAERIRYLVANINSHQNYQTLTSDTTTFKWNDVGADRYEIEITDLLSRDRYIKQTLDGSETEITVSGLPRNSSEITLTISSFFGNKKATRYRRLIGTGEIEDAMLTSHNYGGRLSSTTETFAWSDTKADEYRLVIRNFTLLYDETFDGNTTQITIDGLPDNDAPLDVQIFTRHGIWWHRSRYWLKSVSLRENSEIISHQNGDHIIGDTVTFRWKDVGAESYFLTVKNKEKLIYDVEYDNQTFEATVSGLPQNGMPIIIQLSTKFDHWNWKDIIIYTEEVTPHASITNLADGDIINNGSIHLNWTFAEGADEYRLLITKLGDDKTVYYDQKYDPSTLSALINNLPQAEMAISLKTLHSGYWYTEKIQVSSN